MAETKKTELRDKIKSVKALRDILAQIYSSGVAK